MLKNKSITIIKKCAIVIFYLLFLYSLGLNPVASLKAVLKYLDELKPISVAISLIDKSVVLRS